MSRVCVAWGVLAIRAAIFTVPGCANSEQIGITGDGGADESVDSPDGQIDEPIDRDPNPCSSEAGGVGCSTKCPFMMPTEGSACNPDTPRCRYGEEFCECLEDDATWLCPADCELDRSETKWFGDGCEDCPLVDDPVAGDHYTSCIPGAPACYDRDNGMYFCHRSGKYEYYLLP